MARRVGWSQASSSSTLKLLVGISHSLEAERSAVQRIKDKGLGRQDGKEGVTLHDSKESHSTTTRGAQFPQYSSLFLGKLLGSLPCGRPLTVSPTGGVVGLDGGVFGLHGGLAGCMACEDHDLGDSGRR